MKKAPESIAWITPGVHVLYRPGGPSSTVFRGRVAEMPRELMGQLVVSLVSMDDDKAIMASRGQTTVPAALVSDLSQGGADSHRDLYWAALALYEAGHWKCGSLIHAQEDKLWRRLRDALGLERGTSQKKTECVTSDVGKGDIERYLRKYRDVEDAESEGFKASMRLAVAELCERSRIKC